MSASTAARPGGPPGLLMLCLAAFVSVASMRACDSLLPAFAQSFAVSTGQAALTVSSFAVAYGVLQLLYGPLGDRYGKLRVITVAVLACVLGNGLAVASGSLEAMVIARALSGATAGGIVPLTLAWVGDSVDYTQRQTVLARVMTATLLGTAGGQWVSGVLADTLGWRWVFALLACLFLFTALRLMPLAFGSAGQAPVVGAGSDLTYARKLRTVVSQAWSRRILLTVAIEGAFGLSAVAFIPAFLHSEFGLSLNLSAAIVALYALGGLAYSVFARRLVPRLGEPGLVMGGASTMMLAYLLLAVAPQEWLAIPACLLAGLGFSMLHATLQTHATQMAPAVRGTAASLFGCALFLGQSLGVLGAALVLDALGFRVIFAAAAAVLAVLGYSFARALRQRVPEQA